MEKLMNKNAIKKIFIAIIIVLLFNFIMPTYSNASWGGALFDPITDFVAAIGDAVLAALQYFMYDANISLNDASIFSLVEPNTVFMPDAYGLQASESEITYRINGAKLDQVNIITSIGNFLGDINILDGSGSEYQEAAEESTYNIPIIQYTPEKIFSNQVPALDANFINPRTWEQDMGSSSQDTSWAIYILGEENYNALVELYGDGLYAALNREIGADAYNTMKAEVESGEDLIDVDLWLLEQATFFSNGELEWADNIPVGELPDHWEELRQQCVDIVGNRIHDRLVGAMNEGSEAMNDRSISQALHSTIASWYLVLRNLAIIALLSVLLYVGIRMIISSTAADKAKYKQMLMDWFIALCLVFFLHYIMSFIMTFVETLVDGIASASDNVVVGIYTNQSLNTLEQNYQGTPLVFKTDLTGICRIRLQSKDLSEKAVFLIFYIVLIFYTVMFTWIYLKRAITMAFLTLMAPLVAITYPIDKMRDGQAQAFNMWLKEFVFNALLQPFHLIIYTVFVSSSIQIATSNPIYAILFLAFMTKAEKIMRRMFGFESAETAGGMSAAGMFGGAALFGGVKRLFGRAEKGGGHSGNGGINTKKSPRTKTPISDSKKPSLGSAFGRRNSSTGGGQLTSQQTQRRQSLLGASNSGGSNLSGSNGGTNSSLIISGGTARGSGSRIGSGSGISSGISGASPTRYTRNSRGVPSIRGISSGSGTNISRSNNTSGQSSFRSKRAIRGAIGIAAAGGHVLKGVSKVALGKVAPAVIGTAVGGAIGIASGIASDDMEDVLKYGAAGMAMGGAGVPAVGRRVKEAVGNMAQAVPNMANGVKESFERKYYGDEEATLRAQEREFMSDEDNKQEMTRQLTKNLGRKPTKEEINNAMQIGADYYNAGITDMGRITKAMETEEDIRNQLDNDVNNGLITEEEADAMARDQSKVVSKLASKIPPEELRDPQHSATIKQNIKRQLRRKGGLNDTEADSQADYIIDLILDQNGGI